MQIFNVKTLVKKYKLNKNHEPPRQKMYIYTKNCIFMQYLCIFIQKGSKTYIYTQITYIYTIKRIFIQSYIYNIYK
jgi:hypothetical protein